MNITSVALVNLRPSSKLTAKQEQLIGLASDIVLVIDLDESYGLEAEDLITQLIDDDEATDVDIAISMLVQDRMRVAGTIANVAEGFRRDREAVASGS